MRRGREEMQVNVAGLRRNIKNLAHNYTEAQRKVREATSNDPWGPSSTLMSEIADLTYNVVAFTEIMQMIWKRLNDHGRNWRHVYKALLLLEYLIKTGSEKVGQQCKENIFAIQTLRDFQYVDEGKDQGLNVREKAKQLAALLRDDERLKNERIRALKAKERFAQTASGFGSDTTLDAASPSSPSLHSRNTWVSSESETPSKVDIMCARPTTAGEEELQLQLALAMSREEAEQEEQKRRSDDVRLQLALSQSQNEFREQQKTHGGPGEKSSSGGSHMLDLLDVNLGGGGGGGVAGSEALTVGGRPPLNDPWGMPIPPPRPQPSDPWSVSSSASSATNVPTAADPWSPVPVAPAPPKPSEMPPAPLPTNDPWRVVEGESSTGGRVPLSTTTAGLPPLRSSDPWSPASHTTSEASPSNDLDEFDIISNRNTLNNNKTCVSPNPFEMGGLRDGLPGTGTTNGGIVKRSPHSFLGENSGLVNLDNLITKPTPVLTQQNIQPNGANPFSPVNAPLQPMRASSSAFGGAPQPQANPFLS